MKLSQALTVAVESALRAGDLLRQDLHRPDGPRGTGGKCPADNEAEAIIRADLQASFPDHGIVGEELSHLNRPVCDKDKHCWVIDPNDGTSSFVKRGHRGSAVSIALLRGGLPVLGVVYAFAYPHDGGDLITWAEGEPLRRNGQAVPARQWPSKLGPGIVVVVSQGGDEAPVGCAEAVAPARFRSIPSVAYRMALVAVGEGDIGVSWNGPIGWDYAAGHALLRGAGGGFVDSRGEAIRYTDHGNSSCGGHCFGGAPALLPWAVDRPWHQVTRHKEQPSGQYPPVFPERGRIVTDVHLLSRAQGCLFGQLCGDALGGLVEFKSPTSISSLYPQGVCEMADGGTWSTLAGQPTDDSELALMLARSLAQAGKFDATEVAAAYGHWINSKPFDIGTTTRTGLGAAARALNAGQDPAQAARHAASTVSQANGALMRISPLGIFSHALSAEQIVAMARADALLSHPHPVCQDASAAFAIALASCIRKRQPARSVHEQVLTVARGMDFHPAVIQAIEQASAGPPEDFIANMGHVLIALRNAFHHFLHTGKLAEGVIDTVSRGGDTDTNAAIAGALLGARDGIEAVPTTWRHSILTCRPIESLAGVHQPRPREFWPVDAMHLAERLAWLGMQGGV